MLTGVDADGEEAIRSRFQQAFLSKTDPAPPFSRKKTKLTVSTSSLILIYSVLTSPTELKPHLKIPFFKCLPHFSFHVEKMTDSFHPQLQPAYNTSAALNCGFLPFYTAITKVYPELIKHINWAGKEFSPILL